MTSSQEVDVLIVGAGPAGSACATVLSRFGVNVLLVEKAKFPREKICGDCVNPKSWKLLEALGVADELRMKQIHVIDSFRVTNSQGSTLSGSVSNHRLYPFFSIAREELDSVLLRQARLSGATVREETRVTDIRWDKGWQVVLRGTRSATQSIVSAGFLVGADGRNSLVARTLASRSLAGRAAGAGKGRGWRRVGIQWHTHYQPLIESTLEMFLFDSGYGGVVNVDKHRANVAMVTTPELAQLAKTDLQSFLNKTLSRIARVGKRLDNLQPLGDIAVASPISLMVSRSFHRSAFLIGDAHRTVEPFTGEGVFLALEDGLSTAFRLLNMRYSPIHVRSHPAHGRLWVNRIYSHVLRYRWLADRLVAFGEQIPILIPFAARPILSKRVVS